MTRPISAERSASAQIAIGVCLAALVLAVYARTIGHDLLRWDDGYHIVDNPNLNPISVASLGRIWDSQYGNLYIPIFYSTLALLSSISRSPWIFHAMNVSLHLANTLLVWRLLRRVLTSSGDSARINLVSAIGAAIFAVHPIQVESVAWVSEMRGLLAAFFGLLAIFGFLDRRLSRYMLATLAFIAAVLSKPSAAIVPVLAIVLVILIEPAHWRKSLWRAASWVVIGLAIAIVTKQLQPDANTAADESILTRPLVAADAMGFYIWHILLPIHFSADYSRTPKLLLAGLWKQWLWLALPAVITVFLLCRNRFVRTMLVFFVVALLPVLGLIPFDYQAISTVADRYAYLAMIAIAALVAAVCLRFPRAMPIAFVLIAVLAVGSFHLAGFWKNDATLFTHALDVNPSSALACNNLGYELQLRGQTPQAIDLYRRSIALREDNPMAWTNLGYALPDSPDATEPRRCFERAIELNPNLARAHNGLGILLARDRDLSRARIEFALAAKLSPRDPEPLNNLAVTYLGDDPRKSVEILSQVLRVQPDNIIALHNQGLADRQLGEDQQAADAWRHALSVNPDDSPTLLELGNLLLRDNQPADAEKCFRKLIEIDASSATAHNNLGLALIQQHQVESAAEEFARATELRPDLIDAKRNLAGARLLLKRASTSSPVTAPSTRDH